jgi:SAM-dependent methyltransferase
MAIPSPAVHYPGKPYAQSHPDRIAACAALRGFAAADISRCSVLELGSGDGANLIPMAVALPGSTFMGVDLSESATARGRDVIEQLALPNVRLTVGDVRNLDASLGTFDFVIAHGLYSWVPPDARDALLAACRRHLAPSGVAYVSYSTYPGAHLRDIVRNAMLRISPARHSVDPMERVAAGIETVRRLRSAVTPDRDYLSKVLDHEINRLSGVEPEVVFYDELADSNAPVYFQDFVAQAIHHDLRYVSEALFSFFEDPLLAAPARVEAVRLAETDLVAAEQYLDFVRGGVFRQSLLCHADSTLDESFVPKRVLRLVAASPLKPTSQAKNLAAATPMTFRAPDGGNITTQEPVTKVVVSHLAETWPGFAPVSVLWERVCTTLNPPDGAGRDGVLTTFAKTILELSAAHFVELRMRAPGSASSPGERPRAHALAILQATRGERVTTLRHGQIRLSDEASRRLLPLLDGTKTRNEIVDALQTAVHDVPGGWGRNASRASTAGALDAILDRFAELGVLV